MKAPLDNILYAAACGIKNSNNAMKAPDRIFFTEDFVCGINCNKPVPGKRNVEYIRKDALLE